VGGKKLKVKCFVVRVGPKVCLFLSFLLLFSNVSFCEGGGSTTVSVSNEKERFDESTPIDISTSSRTLTIAGELGSEDRVPEASPTNVYNRENSDEFRLDTALQEGSYVSHVFRLILSLAFIVGLAYVVLRIMRRGRLFSANNDPYLKLVANLNIEQGKTIKVVALGEKAYIIGVSASNITKIAELDDQVLIEAMKLKAEGEAEPDSSSFTKIFASFFPSKMRREGQVLNTGAFAESFNDNFLKKQQERLKNINILNEKHKEDE